MKKLLGIMVLSLLLTLIPALLQANPISVIEGIAFGVLIINHV